MSSWPTADDIKSGNALLIALQADHPTDGGGYRGWFFITKKRWQEWQDQDCAASVEFSWARDGETWPLSVLLSNHCTVIDQHHEFFFDTFGLSWGDDMYSMIDEAVLRHESQSLSL